MRLTSISPGCQTFSGQSPEIHETLVAPRCYQYRKAPAYRSAITELKAEGKCPSDTVHRQVKYLNNIIEADHGKLKRLINPVRGFKSMKTAYATIKGFELMRMFKKGQMDIWKLGQGLTGEIWLIERQFGIYRT
jgi:transposase-like protein